MKPKKKVQLVNYWVGVQIKEIFGMPEISILYKLKKTPTSLNTLLIFFKFINYVYVILIYHFK